MIDSSSYLMSRIMVAKRFNVHYYERYVNLVGHDVLQHHPHASNRTPRAHLGLAVQEQLKVIIGDRRHQNPPQSTTYFHKSPAPDRLLRPTNTPAGIFYQSAQLNPATNKSRIAHAKPIATPRPPRQRLRPNPPIASAPAGHCRVHAATLRRRTCDRGLRFFAT
jgi:hypothetical protein